MTTKTKTMNVPYKDWKGNKYTLVSIECESFNFPLSQGKWVHDHFVVLHFVRNKDGKEYHRTFCNEKVPMFHVYALTNNDRGKTRCLHRVE